MVFSVPYLGYPLIWLADRETRMLVIGLPAALIGLISLGQVFSALRPRRRPEETADPAEPALDPCA